MCLPNFVEFKKVKKDNPIIGYRNWKVKINNPIELISLSQKYIWLVRTVRHKVEFDDSGIYSYNYNYYYNNNYHNNNNYNYYYNNNYYNYNTYNNYNYHNNYNTYNIGGIIKQYGKIAIHESGYRSEYARVDTLFTIRKSDSVGTERFLNWIDKFNQIIENLAKKYNAGTINYQDWKDTQSRAVVK